MEDGTKTLTDMWYASPTVRRHIFDGLDVRWGGQRYVKELFIKGHGDNRIRRHGLMSGDIPLKLTLGAKTAWDLMTGSGVYHSILSYDPKIIIIQDSLVRSAGMRADWLRSLVSNQAFKALKYRADLVRSFTYGIDIDAHGGSSTMAEAAAQVYEIGRYLKDSYRFEPIFNISGRGNHIRFPDYLMARAIDMKALFRDCICLEHEGIRWIDMSYVNEVLVDMTRRIVDNVFGDRHNDVDMGLHNVNDRVFRSLYSVHPMTGTVILPLRLGDLKDVAYEDCNIHNVAYPDSGRIRRFKGVMSGYIPNKYSLDWAADDEQQAREGLASAAGMPRPVQLQVNSLLHLLYQHTPVSFHKYLSGYDLG